MEGEGREALSLVTILYMRAIVRSTLSLALEFYGFHKPVVSIIGRGNACNLTVLHESPGCNVVPWAGCLVDQMRSLQT
jgi:hypothetical protein